MFKYNRILFKVLIFYPLMIFAMGIAYLGSLQLSGNFHEVIPGELYRSGQLSSNSLSRHIQRYGIRTVINLRGENKGNTWYDQEVIATKNKHVLLVNYRMAAKRELNQEQATALIEIMKNVPKPVLIHCQAGADRTGLASALYLAAISNGSELRAEIQLSPVYGHLPFRRVGAPAMDATFELMEPFLGYGKS